MRIQAAVLIVFGLLAGCSSDWDGARRQGAQSAPDRVATGSGFGVSARPVSTFASLPDRGKLLAYDHRLAVRQYAAYTWHPVELSEKHALRAIATGELVIPTPDGRVLRMRYERHVEHPDGNWTWVGRDADGNDAVITFGEHAVFGSISDGVNPPFRVTTSAGKSWLVTTDASRVSHLSTHVPDFLVPPREATDAAASGSAPIVDSAQVAAAAAAGGTTVDVVLGYSTGFAAALGGTSQAVTRLNNLVEITNQGYAQSQVNASVRLVRTLEVNYPDATSNSEVLEKLSGYKSGTGPVTPDPAFAALRAARDTYGADLVSFVRNFQTPQNAGCGIAWLIGGDQDPIDNGYAPFGYSVVSDGTDVDEGDNKTYFCRDETLAHELGHNMGQAHNDEDSSSTGAHAYSYGYREAATNGFYTIMAYRLASSSQFAIRYFGNPNVTYLGRPTGVANVADNARSLNLTTPLIAAFRATVVTEGGKARNDVDADGKSDLLWFQPNTQVLGYWVMNGASATRYASAPAGGGFTVVATGDFNGDRRVDAIWNRAQGDMQIWLGDGVGFSGGYLASYPSGWQLVGTGDVNGDGKSDLLWYQPTIEVFGYWLMDGMSVSGYGTKAAGGGFSIVSTGDYNGDGRVDLIWNRPQGDMQAWFGTGSGFTGQYLAAYPTGWQLVGSGDIDADGKSDLLWYQPSIELFGYWVMNGAAITRTGTKGAGGGFNIIGTGDYNGDGRVDLIWNRPQGDMQMWFGDGVGFAGQYLAPYPSGWNMVMGR